VLKNPWPNTHSGTEWPNSRQRHNDHVTDPANVRPTRARPGVHGDQPIIFNDAGH
jgi:hypothetical protein